VKHGMGGSIVTAKRCELYIHPRMYVL